MKQLFVEKGQVRVHDVPAPAVDVRGILVEVYVAALSPGTETQSLASKKQSIAQTVASPTFRKRLMTAWKEGRLKSAVRRRLVAGAPTSAPQRTLGYPTGYSCAGRVQTVGDELDDVRPGDRVACAGSPHAQVVSVARNLYVSIPDAVTDEEAAFVALGSIALHSVRQAEVAAGDTCVIMGMGIIGQIVAQTVKASGGRTIVTDPVPGRLELARRMGAHLALDPFRSSLAEEVLTFTNGLGADRVIICTASDSAQPIQQALELVRDRGRLVIVGTPRIDIPRGPFYEKEVELRIARSYGPGRYDPEYEVEGHDYPAGYVRWTERRNMSEFLRLVAEKRLNIAGLITHRFPFEEAAQAYETVLSSPEQTMGIVLVRDAAPSVALLPQPAAPPLTLGVAVVGAGSFARACHLPNVARVPGLELRAIVTSQQSSADRAAKEFGAQVATTKLDQALADPAIDLVIIATRHHLHARQTIAALEAGKAVLCEKPVGMTPAEVEQVVAAVERTSGFYAVGFNRRFAPAVERARELLAGRRGPLVLNYRIMGTFIPADHWIYDPVQGGGRIIGEMCHFFDLLCHLVGSELVRITAAGGTLSHPGTQIDDNVICSLSFADGSIASIVYGDLAHRQFPKERLEIFAGEGVLVFDTFQALHVYGFSGQRGMRLVREDKGHTAELAAVAGALRAGQPSPADIAAGWAAMRCSFDVIRQLRRPEVLSNG